MQPPDLDALLHRAVETRLARVLQLLAAAGWSERVETVHDLRVASRRLRAALDLVDDGPQPARRRLRKQAKALTRALATGRELDVQVLRLESLASGPAGPNRTAVLEHFLEGFDQERQRVRQRTARQVARLQFAEAAAWSGDPGPPRSLRDLLEPRFAALPPQGPLPLQDAVALHQLRISAKKLRYALEILAPLLPAEGDAWLGRLKQAQGALGDHHDWVVLEASLWTRHTRLVERRRTALAAGTLELLGQVVERRQAAFEAVPAVVAGLDRERILADLCPPARVP